MKAYYSEQRCRAYYREYHIIIPPPASGNTEDDGDTENIPDNFDNDNAIFEPAAELKADDL